MRRVPVALLLMLLAHVCVASDATPSLPRIALMPDAEAWRVDYVFDAPVKELRFARIDAQGHRAALWTAVDAAWSIALEQGEEVVRRHDGAAFAQVAFRMAPRYVPLEKDYAPFSPFGDGGLLIHTGRYFACAPRCDGIADQAWQFSVEAPAGSHVLQGGRVHGAHAVFTERDDGSNLYVGRARPIETSHLLAVIDAQFPPRARDMLERSFPPLMDFYAARLGALADKPMMFASSDAAHPGGGQGHQGGTLPGQVFVHFYGPRPADEDSTAGAEALRGFFAHEAAHLFQRYESGHDQRDAWLHEGSAEAFALLALEALALVDAGHRPRRIEASLQACADGLDGHALRESATRGAFGNYYRCGELMHLAVDAAARARSAGECDLFCVWRRFLERVAAGEPFSADTYLLAVDEFAGRDTGEFLRAAAMQAHADAREFFGRGLEQAGAITSHLPAAGAADTPATTPGPSAAAPRRDDAASVAQNWK